MWKIEKGYRGQFYIFKLEKTVDKQDCGQRANEMPLSQKCKWYSVNVERVVLVNEEGIQCNDKEGYILKVIFMMVSNKCFCHLSPMTCRSKGVAVCSKFPWDGFLLMTCTFIAGEKNIDKFMITCHLLLQPLSQLSIVCHESQFLVCATI